MFCKYYNVVKFGYFEFYGIRKILWENEDFRLRIKIYLKNKWLGLFNFFDILFMVFRILVFIKY